MEFLILLGAEESAIITESFLKWVCGFLGGAIGVLFYYIRDLTKAQLADKTKQIEEAPSKYKVIEDEIASRFNDRITEKDTKIVDIEKELTEMRVERLQFLQVQIEDAKLQEKGLAELSSDYNALVIDHIEPLLAQSVRDSDKLEELIKKCLDILEYYRKKRERTT